MMQSNKSMQWKAAAFVLAQILVMNHAVLDSVLARVWDACKTSSLFKHDTWEPGLVVISWFTFTIFWYTLDNYVPQAKQYRIQQLEDMSHWKVEGFSRNLPDLPPSSARVAAEVFLSLFFYDLFFTAVHYASHKIPWLYRHMHAKHHAKKVQRASEALRLSVGDQFLDVGCSIAALNLVSAHPLSRSIYNVVIVWLVIELHAGYDFPWMLQNVVPCGLWGGSARHDAHHRVGSVYYQKFFTYIDNLLGTVLPEPAGAAPPSAPEAEPVTDTAGSPAAT